MKKQLIVWGASYQFKILEEYLKPKFSNIILVDEKKKDFKFLGYQIIHSKKNLEKHIKKNLNEYYFIICIGNPNGHIRVKLHNYLKKLKLIPFTYIHPSALISKTAKIGEGSQILENVVIHANVKLGKQCIINSSVSIDHDCILEDGVEMGPRSVTAGRVRLKKYSWFCTGAVAFADQNKKSFRIIGQKSIVGAGSIVVNNIKDNTTVVGNPAKKINYVKKK